METVLSRIQLPELESVTNHIQPPELEPAAGRSQPQLVSSRWNSSQPQDRISSNSYPAAGTRVSCKMESGIICIQALKLETAASRI